MTGSEAWSLIAPILAAHSASINHYDKNGVYKGLNALDEAYVIVFGALNEYDKKRMEEK